MSGFYISLCTQVLQWTPSAWHAWVLRKLDMPGCYSGYHQLDMPEFYISLTCLGFTSAWHAWVLHQLDMPGFYRGCHQFDMPGFFLHKLNIPGFYSGRHQLDIPGFYIYAGHTRVFTMLDMPGFLLSRTWLSFTVDTISFMYSGTSCQNTTIGIDQVLVSDKRWRARL